MQSGAKKPYIPQLIAQLILNFSPTWYKRSCSKNTKTRVWHGWEIVIEGLWFEASSGKRYHETLSEKQAKSKRIGVMAQVT
jgi:hypothetical protein